MKLMKSKISLKIFSICGIIILPIDVVIFYILGALTPGYNSLTKTISELGETGAQYALLTSIYFIISGIIIILFSLGLNEGITESKGSWIGPFLLAMEGGFDFIGSGVFPCDVDCAGQTFSGMMHYVVSLVGLVCLTLAPFFIWKTLKKDEKWAGYEKFSLIMGILLLFLVGFFMISFITQLLVGLLQRILYYTYLTWIFVLAIKLYHIID